jgi:hypothetical protein
MEEAVCSTTAAENIRWWAILFNLRGKCQVYMPGRGSRSSGLNNRRKKPLSQGGCTLAFVVYPKMVASHGILVTGSILILSLTVKFTMILFDLSHLTMWNLYTELHEHRA